MAVSIFTLLDYVFPLMSMFQAVSGIADQSSEKGKLA